MLADTSFDGSFSVCETQACIENAYHKIFARMLIHDSDLKIKIEIEINQIITVILKHTSNQIFRFNLIKLYFTLIQFSFGR